MNIEVRMTNSPIDADAKVMICSMVVPEHILNIIFLIICKLPLL